MWGNDDECIFRGATSCRALSEIVCDKKPCAFFKTGKQHRAARRKSLTRLEQINRYDLIRKYKMKEE